MQAKLIEYAYPTSTTATKAGYGETGCWFIRLYPTVSACLTTEKPIYFTADKQAAIDHAESLPNPYNWMHKYFNS